MIKTFDHAVIVGGVLYSANTPIEFAEPEKEDENIEPEKETGEDKESEKSVEEKEPEKEVTASDKRTGRKSRAGNKDNK